MTATVPNYILFVLSNLLPCLKTQINLLLKVTIIIRMLEAIKMNCSWSTIPLITPS